MDYSCLTSLCWTIIMPPLLQGGGIKWCFCLTSVWRLSRRSDLTREQRGLGRLKLVRGSPRHTRVGHQFQGQQVKGQLVADVLNSQHARIGATWRIKWRYCQLAGAEAYRDGRPPTACSSCVVICQQEDGTELGCPCNGGYFWNWTVTFCIQLNVVWTEV